MPLLAYAETMECGGELEEQETFAVIGATIADNFNVSMLPELIGTSILDKLN